MGSVALDCPRMSCLGTRLLPTLVLRWKSDADQKAERFNKGRTIDLSSADKYRQGRCALHAPRNWTAPWYSGYPDIPGHRHVDGCIFEIPIFRHNATLPMVIILFCLETRFTSLLILPILNGFQKVILQRNDIHLECEQVASAWFGVIIAIRPFDSHQWENPNLVVLPRSWDPELKVF